MLNSPEQASLQSSQPDSALHYAWCDGNARAFDTLYARYRDRLYAYFLHNANDRVQAREMFFDTWVALIDDRDNLPHDEPVAFWIYRHAYQRLREHNRLVEVRINQAGREGQAAPTVIAPQLSLQELSAFGQDRKRFARALIRLTPSHRSLLLMRLEWQLDPDAMKAICGDISAGMRSRLRYIANRFRYHLRMTASR
ncbi:hypothetical protein Q4485_16475 [Granulosicoccaceae sp. 1_MG-2023]|nr:hypothetical protein [Granulosicoccaceae sp. 1_MG-2023]